MLRQQWNALVYQMRCPEIFFTHEWALAVHRAYYASTNALLMLAYEQDSLVGVAALATDRFQREATFLAGNTADYCDFVSLPERRLEFVRLVLHELQRQNIPLVVLANLPADSATSPALSLAADTYRHSLFSRPAFRCAQVVFSSMPERALVRQSVQRKQMTRRHLKAMSKIAPVKMQHSCSWEDIATALPKFEQAHIARFLSTGRVSNLARTERRSFLAELAKLLSKSGWIKLTSLNVGDQPVAWNYGFQFASSWFWYMPTFDGAFARFYPGLCLLSKMVEEACENTEVDRVDLGLGDEKYKGQFATRSRQTLDVTVSASTARHLKEVLRYHAASAIKSSPPLENCIRRLLGRPSAGGA